MAISLGGFHAAYSAGASSLASGVITPQPTAGGTIVIAVGWQWNSVSTETVTSVIDNASGNSYSRIGTQVEDNTNGYRVVLYRAKNINTVASFNVTANMAASVGDLSVLAVELLGADTTEPNGVNVGQSQQNPGIGANAVTTGAGGTPTEDGHLVLCVSMSGAAPGMTVGSGYTTVGATSPAHLVMEYLVQGAAAGVTGTWTTDDTGADFCTFAASFKPAGGGGGGGGSPADPAVRYPLFKMLVRA